MAIDYAPNDTEPLQPNEFNLPEMRTNDRIAVFGRTGTGKSILAHFLFKSIKLGQDKDGNPTNWRLAIDISDSIMDDSLTFFNPDEIPFGSSGSLRYVPNVETMEADINRLYLNIMEQGSTWVWMDEANEVSSAHKTIYGMRRVLLQGRKSQIGHCAVTPRPVDINKSIITQSEHLFIFPLTDSDDRMRISRNIGMSIDEFELTMAALEDYGYLWFSVRSGLLLEMPPLPYEVVDKLE
jgi:hypothetical protein